ncbi:MAG: glycoside hydrolase family 65 protein [Defluviitaleaceae bacterium]|nr:glycoside hydrolase family 65 protein [Defluviitaleaceae bacterium]
MKRDEWILKEDGFNPMALGKCESIMCQGNGYLGLRAATEERYIGERRGLFIAGTFNQFHESEVCELPNAADCLEMGIDLNGETFSLLSGTFKDYQRELDFETGELHRHVEWTAPSGDVYVLHFYRVVSLQNIHTIAQRVEITPLSSHATVKLSTGINGQMTNSGSQHFSEGAKRFYDRRYMQLVQTTTQSNIDFVFTTDVKLLENGKAKKVDTHIAMDRRKIFSAFTTDISKGSTLTIEKITTIHTSRDKNMDGCETAEIQAFGLEHLKVQAALGYAGLAKQSAETWQKLVWHNIPVTVDSKNPHHQLALRFAQYHLQIMAPAHDNRMNIGAKALSGEGYKGHTFWDTEIFALPYYIFTQPNTARSLEEYRYLSLPGAREKAKGNGYTGAQFPWESAWLTDGEVTPLFGAADIVTGLPIPILTGLIEIHISCDVCLGVWQYYMATGDEDFMEKYGYELIFETATFWASRLEDGADGLLHINNVIGPDEYKDGVDDDAFTNYFARWNLHLAMEYYDKLKDTPLLARLQERLTLDYDKWAEKAEKIYVPAPREDGVIPQNRTFLGLKDIDLTKYKTQKQVGSIYNDFNHEQIGEMQVCKQADVLLLILLMEAAFTPEVKRANWNYYEPRTLHDSSLSLSTHCILAGDMGDDDEALALFERACNIDMGPNLQSSNDGVHAGSIGGIWQCAVLGFGGLRLVGGQIRLAPKLPESWDKLTFYAWLRGQKVKIEVSKTEIILENETKTATVEIEINGNQHVLTDMLNIKLK